MGGRQRDATSTNEEQKGWGGIEERAKPQRETNQCARLFVRCVGGRRHDSHCRSKFSTIVSANEGSRYTGSGKRRLRFKASLPSFFFSLSLPSTPMDSGLFPCVSRPFTTLKIWIEKGNADAPGSGLYRTQKSPPSLLCPAILIATVAQTSTRGLSLSLFLLSSPTSADSTTIGNILCDSRSSCMILNHMIFESRDSRRGPRRGIDSGVVSLRRELNNYPKCFMLVIFVFFVLNSDYFFNSSIFVKDS